MAQKFLRILPALCFLLLSSAHAQVPISWRTIHCEIGNSPKAYFDGKISNFYELQMTDLRFDEEPTSEQEPEPQIFTPVDLLSDSDTQKGEAFQIFRRKRQIIFTFEADKEHQSKIFKLSFPVPLPAGSEIVGMFYINSVKKKRPHRFDYDNRFLAVCTAHYD